MNSKDSFRHLDGGNTDGTGRHFSSNYVKKLKARLEWAYQVAHENNQKESKYHKNIMTRK